MAGSQRQKQASVLLKSGAIQGITLLHSPARTYSAAQTPGLRTTGLVQWPRGLVLTAYLGPPVTAKF